MRGIKGIITCGHDDRKHYAKGLCKRCYDKSWWINPQKKARMRRYNIKKYGITQEEYEKLLAEQGGVCAICREFDTFRPTPYMTIDHCHATGGIRGILCARCNSGLGDFKDNPELLRHAAEYLEIKR